MQPRSLKNNPGMSTIGPHLDALYTVDRGGGNVAQYRGVLEGLCSTLSLLPTFSSLPDVPPSVLEDVCGQLCRVHWDEDRGGRGLLGFVQRPKGRDVKVVGVARTECLHLVTSLLLLSPGAFASHATRVLDVCTLVVRGGVVGGGDVVASVTDAALELLLALLEARLLPKAQWQDLPALLQGLLGNKGTGTGARALGVRLLGALPAHLPPPYPTQALVDRHWRGVWDALREQWPLHGSVSSSYKKGVVAAALLAIKALLGTHPGVLGEGVLATSPLQERQITPETLLGVMLKGIRGREESGRGSDDVEAALTLIAFAA